MHCGRTQCASEPHRGNRGQRDGVRSPGGVRRRDPPGHGEQRAGQQQWLGRHRGRRRRHHRHACGPGRRHRIRTDRSGRGRPMTARWSRLALVLALAAVLGTTSASAASLSLTSQALTPYRTCTLTATPATTTTLIDTTVRQGSATSNFGTLTSTNVSSGSAINQRAYLRFDLTTCSPAIPASAVVRLATLRLYLTAVPAACRTIDVFAATVSWTETGITWNNQPFGTAINNPPTASRSGSFTVGTPAGCQNLATGAYLVGGTVTSDVAAFVAGSVTNFGWMLRDDAEGSATTRTMTFSSKELATVGQAPQLVVTYVTV